MNGSFELACSCFRSRWRSYAAWIMGVSAMLLASQRLHATDITWIVGDGVYETNSNWSTSTVPTINDRAIFSDSALSSPFTVSFGSSEALADALFSATAKNVTWKVGDANTWVITNSLVLDEGISGTAIADFTSGTITVTNATGGGAFKVGNNGTGGAGFFKMELSSTLAASPTLMVDQFVITTNSDFIWRAGTVTTLHGATVSRGVQTGFNIGTNSTSTAAPVFWNMLGGTNTITYTSSGATRLGFLASTFGGVTVSGPNTLWSSGAGSLSIGYTGRGALTITNGAHVTSPQAIVSQHNAASSTNNTVIVTDPGSRWDISGGALESSFGFLGSSNQTFILNGGAVVVNNGSLTIGSGTLSFNNQVTVSGANSSLEVDGGLQVGTRGSFNTLIVTNGGAVIVVAGTGSLTMGTFAGASSNLLDVSGGSVLVNSGTINVGVHGSDNALSIGSNGTVNVLSGNLYISPQTDGVGNAVMVLGGSLAVTNSAGSAVLDVAHVSPGSFTFNSGTVTADRLLAQTNSVFTFNGGVLNVTARTTNFLSRISSGGAFAVGDGIHAARLNLGGGLFVADNGLIVSANAVLQGIGTVGAVSNLTVNSNGVLSPAGIGGVGVITNNGDLVLNGGAILDYDLGSNRDQVVVNGNVTLNGTVNIFDAGGFGTGTYTLISYTNALTGGGLAVGAKPDPSLTYTINTNTAGQVNLIVGPGTLSDPYAAWAQQYFGSTNCAKCGGTADFDGDGMNNTNEFLVGFNPTNSAAYAHIISIVKTNTDIRVTYLGANGDSTRTPSILSRTNILEFTTGTVNGSYATNNFASTGATNILSGGAGTGVITNMVDPGGAASGPSRFYRVHVLAP